MLVPVEDLHLDLVDVVKDQLLALGVRVGRHLQRVGPSANAIQLLHLSLTLKTYNVFSLACFCMLHLVSKVGAYPSGALGPPLWNRLLALPANVGLG